MAAWPITPSWFIFLSIVEVTGATRKSEETGARCRSKGVEGGEKQTQSSCFHWDESNDTSQADPLRTCRGASTLTKTWVSTGSWRNRWADFLNKAEDQNLTDDDSTKLQLYPWVQPLSCLASIHQNRSHPLTSLTWRWWLGWKLFSKSTQSSAITFIL